MVITYLVLDICLIIYYTTYTREVIYMLTNKQVAEDFASGITHGKSGTMYIERMGNYSVVFSYGYHFPIAVKTSNLTYFNSDGYSNTTARHKGWVRRALEAKGINIELKNTHELKELF